MKIIVDVGFLASEGADIAPCGAIVFAFVFQCSSIYADNLRSADISINDDQVEVLLCRRKGKSITRPLKLEYPVSRKWKDPSSPVTLFQKWSQIRHPSTGLFDTTAQEEQGTVSLSKIFARAQHIAYIQPPDGYVYSSHSLRVGGYNDIRLMGMSKDRIMFM